MIVLYVIAGICCLISLGLWVGLLRRISTGQSLLAQDPQELVPWGLLDVYLIFAVSVFLIPLVFALIAGGLTVQPPQAPVSETSVLPAASNLQPAVPVEQPQPRLFDQALLQANSKVLALIIVFVYLYSRHRIDAHDVGLSFSHLRSNVKLGLIGFFLIVPPVIALQSLLTMWVPYEHPTLNALTADRSTLTFLAILVSAGIVTPVFEEFIFRVLIQGFLQRWAAIGQKNLSLILLGGQLTEQPAVETHKRMPLWPIFASAAIFALMHSGQGPAPVPLFFLAIGLGYLYLRSHSAIPGIIVHLMLNVWSLIFLAVQNASS